MMRIRLDINKNPIADIAVWNTEKTDDEGRHIYEVFDLEDVDLYGEAREMANVEHLARVRHHRNDGAVELTRRVMDALPDDFTEP